MVGRLSGRRIYDAWRGTLFIAMLALGVMAPFAAFQLVDVETYLLALAIYLATVGIWFGWPDRSES